MMKPPLVWAAALQKISDRAQAVDIAGVWPRDNLCDLARCGAMRWSLPKIYGGQGLAPIQLHHRYAQLASACLSTALILTQRDAALEFLICTPAGPSKRNAEKLLLKLASNRIFASIGIAQLTTSGQHQQGGVTAIKDGQNWRVSGVIPWSTGADYSDFLIAGACAEQKDQLLFILDMKKPGVRVCPAPCMAVLNATNTSAIELRNVLITARDVLSGPCPNALAIRNAYRRFSLNTCILPLGVAAGALQLAQELVKPRTPRCRAAISELCRRQRDLACQVYTLGADKVEANSASRSANMRAQCNDLCFRCAASCLELAKGRGLMMEHPAQRRLREAMFFFVWSSGSSVTEETLASLSNVP